MGTRRFRFVPAPRLLAPVGSLLLLVSMSSCVELSDEPGGIGGGGMGGGTSELSVIDPEPVTKPLGVVCSNSVIGTLIPFSWELTVDPGPIESGGKFSASFDGIPFFPRSFWENAQVFIDGGVKEVNILDFRLTIVAHAGATGPDVVLTTPALPYQCALEDPPGTRPGCDPANDLPDGEPGPVGNTDCQPTSASNPCGRFVVIPTSEDCSPGGDCWNVGREDPETLCPQDDFCQEETKVQCVANGFCVTGGLAFPLAPGVEQFVADIDGEVLLGWHEPGRGSSSWAEPPRPVFEQPIGPSGIRVYVGSLGVALECVLGEEKQSTSFLVGTLPDDKLISFPIPDAACIDGTPVCRPGFASFNGGECRFSEASPPFFVEDPIVTEDPSGSLTSCRGPVDVIVGETFLASEAALESPSLLVRATTELRNVDDGACIPNVSPIAEVDYLDGQGQRLSADIIAFNLPAEVSFSYTNPLLRSTKTHLWRSPTPWSSGPDACCERTFQTIWEATVAQCEGW